MLSELARETPDIETASESYASRFAGTAGRYLLEDRMPRSARPWPGGAAAPCSTWAAVTVS